MQFSCWFGVQKLSIYKLYISLPALIKVEVIWTLGIILCKKNTTWRCRLAWKCRKCVNISIYRLHMVIYPTEVLFSFFFLKASHCAAIWVYCLSMKSVKDWLMITRTLAPHVLAFVHDVTDTDCWEQNGNALCLVLVTFKHQFQIKPQKLCEKLGSVYF